MKLCINCRYFHMPQLGKAPSAMELEVFSKCSHPSLREEQPASLVTGEISPPRLPDCGAARLPGYACGPDGVLWEERADETL